MNLDQEFRNLSVAEAVFYTRLGLQLEVISLSDVSDWVDEVLLREGEPDAFFVALYRLLHTEKHRLLEYLRQSFPEASFPVRPALAWLQQQFASGTQALKNTLTSLYQLRTLVTSEQEAACIYGLAADYEQAAATTEEARELVARETAAFLGCYREYTFANRAEWPRLDAVLEERLAKLRR
ncbi:hypothetical protein LGH70_09320 [Hymenobacter sp. BT635]|uniref:Uncharacterized protein n=1 Tax=Hymenobacter nitidus TaxID=2880929 RepID=A0ABS8AEX1_9BACT|nr:hypothetical protein [Hymenobacter nitidus]MCB2377780.1 hypothetical protein [Hymenobacter nitidus]